MDMVMMTVGQRRGEGRPHRANWPPLKPCLPPTHHPFVQALDKAIALVKPGTRYRDVGDAIAAHVRQNECAGGGVRGWRGALGGEPGCQACKETSPQLPSPFNQ